MRHRAFPDMITHRKVGGKARVNARAIRRADDDDRDMSTAEDRQDVLEVGGKAAVGDDDCRMVGTRGECRSHLGLDTVVARRAFTGGEQAVAEHSRWIEVVRARVDVDLSGVRDELGFYKLRTFAEESHALNRAAFLDHLKMSYKSSHLLIYLKTI